MTRLLVLLATALFALAVAAQEPPSNDPLSDDPPPAGPVGEEASGEGGEQAEAAEPPEAESVEDPKAEALAGVDGAEDPIEDFIGAPTEDPGAEELAEAAAAAGGEIGEVDEDFTPRDEISEDYPVPLPADI